MIYDVINDIEKVRLRMSAKSLVNSRICVSWRSAWNASSLSVACSSSFSWRIICSFIVSFLAWRWYSSNNNPAPIVKMMNSPRRFDPSSIAICSFSYNHKISACSSWCKQQEINSNSLSARPSVFLDSLPTFSSSLHTSCRTALEACKRRCCNRISLD